MIAARLTCLAPVIAMVIAPAADAQVAASAFRRDPARMQAKQAQLLQSVRAQDPQAARHLEQAFRQDIVAAIKPTLNGYALSTDDVVDMTAFYWVIAWEASHGLAGVQTDPAKVKGVRTQIGGAMRASLPGMDDAAKQDIADTMLLQGLFAEARMTAAKQVGQAQIKAASDAIYRESSAMLKTDLRAVEMTASGFRPTGNRSAGPNTSPAVAEGASATPAAGKGRTPPVTGYYFRAISGGAGVTYEPLVLFGNGDYVELDDVAVADLDAAADKAKAPKRWGRWRKEGATFLLTSSTGRVSDYRLGSGSFFPAFTAQQGPKLSGVYKATSGSTMYMADGPVTTLGVNLMNFHPDGSFTQDRSGGGIAPGVTASSRRGAAGRWRLDGTTLEIAYSDGRVARKQFLWAAAGTPPRPDIDMAFIGGTPFLRDD